MTIINVISCSLKKPANPKSPTKGNPVKKSNSNKISNRQKSKTSVGKSKKKPKPNPKSIAGPQWISLNKELLEHEKGLLVGKFTTTEEGGVILESDPPEIQTIEVFDFFICHNLSIYGLW